MKLFPHAALPSGTFQFQVIVRVQLDERLLGWDENNEPIEPAIGYYKTLGVTAATAASTAVQIVEQGLSARPTVGDHRDPKGSILEFELTILEPSSV